MILQFHSLRFLLRQTHEFADYSKLLVTLLLSKTPFFKRKQNFVDIRFKDFYLRFRPSQGALTQIEEIKSLTSDLFPKNTIGNWIMIDCGANIGLFSLTLKEAAFIIAIEPNLDTIIKIET